MSMVMPAQRHCAMYRCIAPIVLLFGCQSVAASAPIIDLYQNNFEREVNGQATFIMFHAPWCGFSKHLKPTWELLAEAGIENLKVARVDGTRQLNLMKRFGIKGFPSLLYISEDGELYKFKGQSSIENLMAFVSGGWKDAPIYDPRGPPARKSMPLNFSTVLTKEYYVLLYKDHPIKILFVAFLFLLLSASFMLSFCQVRVDDDFNKPVPSGEAEGKKDK